MDLLRESTRGKDGFRAVGGTPVMGKHPDLMVAHPTSTIFTTIGRNYEISYFFAKNFENVYTKTSTKRPTFGRNLPKVVNFGEKKNISTMNFLDVEM